MQGGFFMPKFNMKGFLTMGKYKEFDILHDLQSIPNTEQAMLIRVDSKDGIVHRTGSVKLSVIFKISYWMIKRKLNIYKCRLFVLLKVKRYYFD